MGIVIAGRAGRGRDGPVVVGIVVAAVAVVVLVALFRDATPINPQSLKGPMRLLGVDVKRTIFKVLLETPDDLWHLSNIVEPEDIVSGLTYRREEQRSDAIRPERGEKKRMWLSIRVEDCEFREFTERFRVKGVIVEGPQDHGQHHSIDFEPGDTAEICKQVWKPSIIKRLKESEKETRRPNVLVLAIDDEEATLASLWRYGVQSIAVIRAPGGGKRYGGGVDRRSFYGEVLAVVQNSLGESNLPVLVVGPGFFKEDMVKFAREKGFSGWSTIATNQAGMGGVSEALKAGGTNKILAEHRLTVETTAVETLLEAIKMGKPSTYGLDAVKKAAKAGAISELLVLEDMLHNDQYGHAARVAEENGAQVTIISPLHDAGKHLKGLGGIGAILRFALDP